MRILIFSDTWAPNVNGVATTLAQTKKWLQNSGHDVLVVEPSMFRSIPAPTYPEVRFAWDVWKIKKIFEEYNPQAVHIATEGPIGIAARIYCGDDIPYTTSYHSKFPEYFNEYFGIPVRLGYSFIKFFHKHGRSVLVTNNDMKKELTKQGMKNLIVWNRGVDREIFNSEQRIDRVKRTLYNKYPVMVYIGRVSKEKGLEDFLSITELGGTKIVVGDGPYKQFYQEKYPDAHFIGYKFGQELASYYANADVFVFPSRTDTLGIVMLESLACGTPIAAYPVTGPNEIVIQGINGYLDINLTNAIAEALKCDRLAVEQSSKQYSWEDCTKIFADHLVPIDK